MSLKKNLYKRLLGMVSRYALNQIAVEFDVYILLARILPLVVVS